MLQINKNIKTTQKNVEDYIWKNYKNLVELNYIEFTEGGVHVWEGKHENGCKYEFYYTPECKYFRSIYDGWNSKYIYDLDLL